MRQRVSIVIPARNAERTLAETLNSLIAQMDADWEAIIVDDGSTDATSSIIAEFAAGDRRFVGVTGRGEGASSARNIGLSHARGKWVVFLDSDDWIAPAFLATMHEALDGRPDAVAAYCADQRVTPTGEPILLRWTDQIARSAFDVFARRCGVAIHCVLVDRQLVMELGGFDTSLRTCEDWDLWQRVARTGGRFIGVAKPLGFYRMSDHSLSHDVSLMIADARIVIDRGFAPDPRVGTPAQRYAGGASSSGGSAHLAFAYFCLWCAAVEVGRGRDGRSLLVGDAALSDSIESGAAIEQILIEALAIGARCSASELAIRWPSFGEHLVSLVRTWAAGSRLPGFAKRIQYRVERQILQHFDLSVPAPLGLIMGLRVDIRRLTSVKPPPGVDLLYIYLCEGDRILAVRELPVFGIITARQLAFLAIQTLGFRRFWDGARPSHRSSFWRHAAHHITRQIRRPLTTGFAPRTSLRAMAREALRSAAADSAEPAMIGQASDRILAELVAQARREGELAGGPATKSTPAAPRAEKSKRDRDKAQFWDAMFEAPDPWNYGSEYERIKYQRQLSLLPHRRIGRALEVACAEGWFTEQLAERVERLIAVDISWTALDRARRRCANRSNISFERLDISVEAIPQGLDLIVCSEVLYYLADEAELAQICRRLAGALGPDGHLLTANAFVLKDNLDRTAFDWEQPFGAEVIARAFENTPDLTLERSLQTELYRIDLYRRLQKGELRSEPAVEILPIGAKLDGEVTRCILWGGATARRADLFSMEKTDRVPVLLYHRVAEDGPQELSRYRVSREQFLEQLRWLRRQGYHAISSADLASHFESALPFAGRPILITFDDGMLDFHDAAWPILRDCDLTAEVFVVTELVGQFAEWDRRHGKPAALMTREQIQALHRAGAHFGSHLASHTAIDCLTSRELAVELARSRAAIETWLGQPVQSFAAPYGIVDERLFRLADFCGYRAGFTTAGGVAKLGGHPLRLPRIEIQGGWPMSEFIQALEGSR